MAFPTPGSTTATAFGSDATEHLVDMPATVASGDLLVAFWGTHATGAGLTVPSGWTALRAETDYTEGSGGVIARVADGTEGGTTVDFATSAARRMVVHVVRVTGWHGTISGGAESGGHVTRTSIDTDIDSIENTASWGSDDNLWIWYVLSANDDSPAANAPTGYSDFLGTVSGGGTNFGCAASTAFKESAAASEDPDNVGWADSSEVYISGTVVVRPGSSGGGGGGGITLPLLHAIQD